MKILDAAATRRALPMEACITAMARAMRAISEGRVSLPPRQFLPAGADGEQLGLMPAVCEEAGVSVTKVLTITPANAARDQPTIQGFVALMDIATGTTRLIADAGELTAIRTAAVSALATQYLAQADATSLGIFGTGTQAHAHLQAIRCVRPISEVRVWGRNPEKVSEFLEAERDADLNFIACHDASQAAGAQIICTVTGAREPVLEGRWVQPGTHVNLVGAHSASAREADSALMSASTVFVDARSALAYEGGDVTIPIGESVLTEDDLGGELGELIAGAVTGRRNAAEVTVFNSVGLAAQDLFAMLAIVERDLS